MEYIYGNWKVRTDRNLIETNSDLDMVNEIKQAKLRWLGHVERMIHSRIVKKIFMVENVHNDLRRLKIVGCQYKVLCREQWLFVYRQVQVVQCLSTLV